MPHSCPAVTSLASSLKRLSCDSLPSWITTLSRISRTLAPRSTVPSVTRQPAMLPPLEALKISRICALPRLGVELGERTHARFQRALHVRLDHQREFLAAGRLGLCHHLLERATHTGG